MAYLAEISNIDFQDKIYFHYKSVPHTLENTDNKLVLQKLIHQYTNELVSEEELPFVELNDNLDLIDLYIMELKSDWIEIDSSDTDNYLSEIDRSYFYSEFCEVYMNYYSKTYYFIFKLKNDWIRINISQKNEIEIMLNDITEATYRKYDYIVMSFEDVYDEFNRLYKESTNPLSTIAKDILIRSHSEYLHELSKEQIIVKL